MQRADIEKELTIVFRDIFQDNTIVLMPSMTAKDIDGWDSLNHINLVLAVEKRFKVRLTVKEISRLPNVGAFTDIIDQRFNLT